MAFQDLLSVNALSGALQLLANATTYQAWLTAAEKLDELEGVGEWKKDPTSPYYDSRLIQERLVEMKRVGLLLPDLALFVDRSEYYKHSYTDFSSRTASG